MDSWQRTVRMTHTCWGPLEQKTPFIVHGQGKLFIRLNKIYLTGGGGGKLIKSRAVGGKSIF